MGCDFDGRDQESIHDILAVDVEKGLEGRYCGLVMQRSSLQNVFAVSEFSVAVRRLAKASRLCMAALEILFE